ncbi:MAG: VCBS repeat-containing protein [Oscillospiraceae bacterium]|nr:VCBS repeat-containing protein [Oscillospiraceae bacterium]
MKLHRTLICFLLGGILLLSAACGAEPIGTPVSGNWASFRGSELRTGRVSMTGDFAGGAALVQELDFHSTHAYAAVLPDIYSAVERTWAEGDEESGTAPEVYRESDTPANSAQAVKYAHLFAPEGDDSLYRIEAYDDFSHQRADGTEGFRGLRVYNAAEEILWETEFPGVDMQRPHVTVADMTGNGKLDIVVTGWSGLFITDNQGSVLTFLSQDTEGWHNCRKRGYQCIADLNKDGLSDVVIVGCFPWTCDALMNLGNGEFKVGWSHVYDSDIASAKVISKPIFHTAADFDGDGETEVFVNLWNYSGNGNWTGVFYDGESGAVKYTLPDVYTWSAEYITAADGMQTWVFFCTDTFGQSVLDNGTQRIYTFKDKQLQELYRIDNALWQRPRRYVYSETVAAHSDGQSMIADDMVFIQKQKGGDLFFAALQQSDGSSRIESFRLETAVTAKAAGMQIHVPAGVTASVVGETVPGTLLVQFEQSGAPAVTVTANRQMTNLGRFPAAGEKDRLPIAADLDGDGKAEILIAAPGNHILCYAQEESGQYALSWQAGGHGQWHQYAGSLDFGLHAADINGDGKLEVLASGQGEQGAALFAYDCTGKRLWQHEFPDIHGGELTSFDGCLGFYGTAKVKGESNPYIIVSTQRVVQHSGDLYALRGADGSTVWHYGDLDVNGNPYDQSGFAFSVYDVNDDGTDEIMLGYGNNVFVASAADGSFRAKEFMTGWVLNTFDYEHEGYSGYWVQETTPVPLERKNGKTYFALFNMLNNAGVASDKLKIDWIEVPLTHMSREWQCLADLDGDGTLWAAEISTRLSDGGQELFAYNARTGAMRKNFARDFDGYMPIAFDADGDGKDEIVVRSGAARGFVVIDGTGKTVCTAETPDGSAPFLIAADLNGSGMAQLIGASATGKLYIYKGVQA